LTSFSHGDLHEQIDALTRQIAEHPDNATLLLKRADLHRIHGEPAEALKDLDRASKIDPTLRTVDLVRGKVLLDSNQPALAQVALDRFLAQVTNHVDGLVTRARVRIKLGENAKAIDDFSKAISNSPRPDPQLYLDRASLFRSMNPPRLDEAVRGLNEGIEKLGPLVTLELPAIELEVLQNKYDAALQRLDRLAASASRKETWLVRRAEILTKAGRFGEARETFAAALKAIQTLPDELRNKPATRDLEARVRTALAATSRDSTSDSRSASSSNASF
jgi:predicted Zn-dependent protease